MKDEDEQFPVVGASAILLHILVTFTFVLEIAFVG